MASIYIHIPYCKQACTYCDFHFRIAQKDKIEMLKSIEKEIVERASYLNQQKIRSIYFGGGTPSILDDIDIKKILSKNNLKLEKLDGMNFNIIKDEWTVSSDTSINYIIKSIKL